MFLGCFCPYVRQPHNHIGWATSMAFASINPTYPRTNLWNFHEKILRIGDFEMAILKNLPFWFFFLEKKFKMAFFSIWPFFKIANSWNFFAKISQIGPWVSTIDWCKGRQCSSTYLVERLSDIRAKTAKKHKKCIFCLFLPLYQTASQPYRLRYINALRIHQFY